MGGVVSRVFHRKPDDGSKPKHKKPRRFGSLRRARTDENQTGARVTRSSTMPSRPQRSSLPTRDVTEDERNEQRLEIMRDVMDTNDNNITSVNAPPVATQINLEKPSVQTETEIPKAVDEPILSKSPLGEQILADQLSVEHEKITNHSEPVSAIPHPEVSDVHQLVSQSAQDDFEIISERVEHFHAEPSHEAKLEEDASSFQQQVPTEEQALCGFTVQPEFVEHSEKSVEEAPTVEGELKFIQPPEPVPQNEDKRLTEETAVCLENESVVQAFQPEISAELQDTATLEQTSEVTVTESAKLNEEFSPESAVSQTFEQILDQADEAIVPPEGTLSLEHTLLPEATRPDEEQAEVVSEEHITHTEESPETLVSQEHELVVQQETECPQEGADEVCKESSQDASEMQSSEQDLQPECKTIEPDESMHNEGTAVSVDTESPSFAAQEVLDTERVHGDEEPVECSEVTQISTEPHEQVCENLQEATEGSPQARSDELELTAQASDVRPPEGEEISSDDKGDHMESTIGEYTETSPTEESNEVQQLGGDEHHTEAETEAENRQEREDHGEVVLDELGQAQIDPTEVENRQGQDDQGEVVLDELGQAQIDPNEVENRQEQDDQGEVMSDEYGQAQSDPTEEPQTTTEHYEETNAEHPDTPEQTELQQPTANAEDTEPQKITIDPSEQTAETSAEGNNECGLAGEENVEGSPTAEPKSDNIVTNGHVDNEEGVHTEKLDQQEDVTQPFEQTNNFEDENNNAEYPTNPKLATESPEQLEPQNNGVSVNGLEQDV